jgi:hypothetical protein
MEPRTFDNPDFTAFAVEVRAATNAEQEAIARMTWVDFLASVSQSLPSEADYLALPPAARALRAGDPTCNPYKAAALALARLGVWGRPDVMRAKAEPHAEPAAEPHAARALITPLAVEIISANRTFLFYGAALGSRFVEFTQALGVQADLFESHGFALLNYTAIAGHHEGFMYVVLHMPPVSVVNGVPTSRTVQIHVAVANVMLHHPGEHSPAQIAIMDLCVQLTKRELPRSSRAPYEARRATQAWIEEQKAALGITTEAP